MWDAIINISLSCTKLRKIQVVVGEWVLQNGVLFCKIAFLPILITFYSYWKLFSRGDGKISTVFCEFFTFFAEKHFPKSTPFYKHLLMLIILKGGQGDEKNRDYFE